MIGWNHSALENMYIELNGKSADCVIAGYIETSDSGEKIIMNEMPKGFYSNNTLATSFLPLMLCYGDFFEAGIQPFLWINFIDARLLSNQLWNQTNVL